MSIGRLDYARLAEQHRPHDPAGMRAAVLVLDAQGLAPADIAAALRLSIPAVNALLTARPVAPDEVAAVQFAAQRSASCTSRINHASEADKSITPDRAQRGEAAT